MGWVREYIGWNQGVLFGVVSYRSHKRFILVNPGFNTSKRERERSERERENPHVNLRQNTQDSFQNR